MIWIAIDKKKFSHPVIINGFLRTYEPISGEAYEKKDPIDQWKRPDKFPELLIFYQLTIEAPEFQGRISTLVCSDVYQEEHMNI
jgi:hypothetical protein